jgi:mannosyltransferase OCH1-like enzyme
MLLKSCLFFFLPVLVCAQDFYTLMGKETKHWNYLKEQEDRSFLENCKEVYEKSFKELAAQKKSTKIPKVVHFIWLGPKPFPPESVENVRTWMAQHPDWTFKFWTDRDRPTPCRGMQKILVKDFSFNKLERCFVQSQNFGEKSDILRYEILYQEGGVYVDHDANCLKSFQNLHTTYDFYCGLETPHEPFVGRTITCGNGVLGSRPKHPAVKRVIDLIGSRWDGLGKKYQGRDTYSKTEVVMQRTYIALTTALKEGVLNRDGNVDIVLPAAYFFAKSGMPSLYSKHFYATAWAEDRSAKTDFEKYARKKLEKILQKTQNIHLLSVILLCGNLVLFIFLARNTRKARV